MQPITLFTLYTENKDTQGIMDILDTYFDSYTLIPAYGRYKGVSEHSLIVQAVGSDSAAIHIAAQAIKERNQQDSVLVTEQPITPNIL